VDPEILSNGSVMSKSRFWNALAPKLQRTQSTASVKDLFLSGMGVTPTKMRHSSSVNKLEVYGVKKHSLNQENFGQNMRNIIQNKFVEELVQDSPLQLNIVDKTKLPCYRLNEQQK